MPHFSDQASAPQTDTTLVGAPGAGKQIVVDMLFVASDTAQTITLESGTATLKWQEYLAANDGHFNDGNNLFRCADNAALTYTSTATAESFVAGRYRVQNYQGD